MKIFLISIITFCFLASSCKQETKPEEKASYTQVKEENKEKTIKINKDLLEVNKDIINKYIERHNLKMTETESGLMYMITNQTTDIKVESGCEVEFCFKTSLMNGQIIYDSEKLGNRKLKIDINQEETGLNEGLKLLRKGEKAYFIIPPHLAFGVAGDAHLVPPYSVLVYEIEIVDIKLPECSNLDNEDYVL